MLPGPVSNPLNCTGSQISDIGNATDVDDDAMDRGMAKHRLMKCGDQRCAFAAGGDIAAAKIANHNISGQFRQQCAVAELDRVAGIGTMPNRLAVAADG